MQANKKRFGQVRPWQKGFIIRLGIDLGGTKIEILVIDIVGHEVFRQRVITPKNDYAATIRAIVSLIASAEEEIKQQCNVGICTPGSISPASGLLRNSNSVCLNNKPFKQDLEKAIGKEIRISNDANCFALSEAVDGAAEDSQVVFGIIIGTGVGAGIVVNKKVLVGTNAIGGEWGHNPLPWSEKDELELTKCWCGQHGCIETFLSGTGLEADFKRSTGRVLSAEEIDALATAGDMSAEDVWARYEHRMARCLAQVINLLDPDSIVIGGGMSNIRRLYENIPERWEQWVFSDRVNTKLISPKYGDSSGVRGAAWLWDSKVLE